MAVKPQLGNALAEKPRLLVKQSKAGASGADPFPSRGLGTRNGAWEREDIFFCINLKF